MRSGAGTHTSAGGVIYTGEWHEDKVCNYCSCHDSLWFLHCCIFLSSYSHISHRCMAEEPCSIRLELYMKENSKTTCTTAWEHTPSKTAPFIKDTFTRTGMKLFIFGSCCNFFFNIFSEKRSVFYKGFWFDWCATVQFRERLQLKAVLGSN